MARRTRPGGEDQTWRRSLRDKLAVHGPRAPRCRWRASKQGTDGTIKWLFDGFGAG